MTYKLGSLFDGSGGFPLAGTLCGIEPVWAAEVEPYPIAVTRSRLPNMKHLGDITKVNGAEIEPVDIITFGSPCQDLSVAGKRAGLKHEANGDEETTRSGLFMEAVRIIKEMRGATNGVYPRFALWENVPGAFSSNKGEDFRIVLEELIKICEPGAVMPPVPKAGWAYADSYTGDGWSIAYRVFDAQFWGVPQRRRRIHLVVDFGGECAREILFKCEGLHGHFAEGRTPWQTAPGNAADGAGTDDREGGRDVGGRGLATVAFADVAATLRAGAGAPKHEADFVGRQVAQPLAFAQNQRDEVRDLGDKAGALQAQPGMKQQTFISQTVDFGRTADRIYINPKTSVTLSAQGGGMGAKTGLYCLPVYCLQGNGIDRADTAGCNGRGWKEGTSYTLNTIDRPAVAYGIGNGQANQSVTPECVGALTCMHDQQAICFRQGGFAEYIEGEVGTLRASDGDFGGGSENLIQTRYIVRRLTPTECARLQGFPDWWGHVNCKDSFTPEEYHFWLGVRNTHASINGKQVKDYTEAQMLTWYNKLHTDGAEYKMWGNGIALPPALYCMQGIVDAFGRE